MAISSIHLKPDHSQLKSTSRNRPLMDIGDLAASLKVKESYIRRLIHERRIPFHKIGKFIRFNPDEIDTWVQNQHVDAYR